MAHTCVYICVHAFFRFLRSTFLFVCRCFEFVQSPPEVTRATRAGKPRKNTARILVFQIYFHATGSRGPAERFVSGCTGEKRETVLFTQADDFQKPVARTCVQNSWESIRTCFYFFLLRKWNVSGWRFTLPTLWRDLLTLISCKDASSGSRPRVNILNELRSSTNSSTRVSTYFFSLGAFLSRLFFRFFPVLLNVCFSRVLEVYHGQRNSLPG